MVDNKSKTSLIRQIQKKNISLMKINNIILVLRTRIILLSSFVIYFFRICHSGCFPIMYPNTVNYYRPAGAIFMKVLGLNVDLTWLYLKLSLRLGLNLT